MSKGEWVRNIRSYIIRDKLERNESNTAWIVMSNRKNVTIIEIK